MPHAVRPALAPIGLLLLALVAACGAKGRGQDSGGSPAVAAPAPPPPYTLTVDLSIADGGLNLDDVVRRQGGASFAGGGSPVTNHLQAAAVIMVVNATLAQPLALPVALLAGAAAAPAQLGNDGGWVRSYDVAVSEHKWTANLHGTADGDVGMRWSLRVTTPQPDTSGCCNDFEVAAGESFAAGGGVWTIYDLSKPTKALPLFTVTYTGTAADDKTLSFQVGPNRPAAERFGAGSRLAYAVHHDEVTMTYQDVSEAGPRTIIWSRSTLAGSHTDPQGRRACWVGRDKGYGNGGCQ